MASPKDSAPDNTPTSAPIKSIHRLLITSYLLALVACGALMYAFSELNAAANQGYNSVAPSPAPDLTIAWGVYWGGLLASLGTVITASVARSRAKQHPQNTVLRDLAVVGLLIGSVEMLVLMCGGAFMDFAMSFCGHGC